MDNELLAQILQELRDIRADISWFKEREELKHQALLPKVPEIDTAARAKALGAFVKKTQKKK